MRMEAIKGLEMEVDKMHSDHPRLYGLIRMHMSVESRDKVSQERNYALWHADKDPERLWQTILRTHKVDCMSNINEVMEPAGVSEHQHGIV
jgi:hypothetical protein